MIRDERSKPNREGEAPAELENNGSELPTGWAVAPFGNIVNLVNRCPFKLSHWKQDGLPIIRIQNLNKPQTESELKAIRRSVKCGTPYGSTKLLMQSAARPADDAARNAKPILRT